MTQSVFYNFVIMVFFKLKNLLCKSNPIYCKVYGKK